MRRQKTDSKKVEAVIEPKKLSVGVYKKRFFKIRKSFFKHAFIFANIAIVIGVIGLIIVGNGRSETKNTQSILSQPSDKTSAPLDTLSAADIAANIALSTGIPEAPSISNQADSVSAQVQSARVEETIVNKPQLVTGGSKSKEDIQVYTTVAGDTVGSLAVKFGVTSDTIKWSNGLSGDSLQAGKALRIPPRNGIVYLVTATDTVDSIASRYNANKEQLIAFNDLEISSLTTGEYILIPDGTLPAPTRTTTNTSFTVYGFSPVYGSNGYAPGFCTYYVASRINVPRNWGNANTWDSYARASGWTVSSVPVAGAILQTDAGWAGHVGIVEAVSDDGTMIKYSDMNGLAGFARVGYSDWTSAAQYTYLYR